MATSQSARGVPSKDAQIEGYVCIQSHILLSLTCLDSQFQSSNHQLLQDSNQDRLNVEHASPSLSCNGNTNNNTTPKSTFNTNHRNDLNSITDAITPTQISSRQAAESNSTPRARLNLDCSVGRPQFDHAANTASARYEQALRFHHDGFESSGNMQDGMNWSNVWASLRNGEISIWSDRSSSISSPESPLCVIPLSTFNHSSTDPSNSKAASWEITLFSNPPTSLRSASYGSTNQRSLGHQAQTISSSQSPPLDQASSSTTFHWTRSISKGSLMKSSSSRTLADALRFGTSSSSSTDAPIPDQNKRELNHSNSQSTLNADVKENRKERGGSAWAKILRSRRLKSFMPTSQSSDSLSDQLSINGSVASSSRHGGEGMGSEDGNARDRGTSISSSPLSRSIALPSPGFSSSSHSTTATSINQSPTTSSCPKTRQVPSKIILQLPSASSMSQWNEAIKSHSETSFQSDRSQTSPTNANSRRKRPPLASIPGFSSPPSGESRDAYIQSSTSRSNLQQPLSPSVLPRNQASSSGRFGTLSSSQSESILVMQATSESKLSQRRKERADAARNQEPSQSETDWNDPFPSKQPEEGINGSIKSQSRHPRKQSSVPVVSSGPLTSSKSSSSRTGLSALLTGRKRGREDQKKQPSQEQVDTALHRQVQNCRASIEITPGNSRGKGEFYRPSTSSGASLKSFGSNSGPANEAADHHKGKAAKKRDARPTSAAGYEHVQARNSFTLTSGLTHAQNLAKQYLAGQRETPPSPVLSNASCVTTASVSEASSEYVPPGMPFLKELANHRTSSPLAKEAMLPELTSLTIPSRDGQGRMRGASPQLRSSSPLGNQSAFTTPNSITQSLYTPSEGGESALDRFARVREGSFSQGPHGLGLEGVDQGLNGNGERFTFKSQRSWSKSPSFAPSSEICSTSTSPNPQSTFRQVTLKRLRGTPSRGSMESSREEDLEESDLPDRRSSLNGSALGISFSPSLNLPFKSSSPSLSGSSNALGLSRSPSLRGLANKLLLRPSSASGISSPLQFSSSRNSTSEPRESRDSGSSYYDGRASSGDTSNSGRSLEFDNEIDIDDYEMIPSPSLPIINLHPSSTPTRLTTELAGSTNEKASLGRKTRKTAEKWANRLGSSPRMNSSTNKTIADVQDNDNSLSVSEANHQRRKQSSSSSSNSSSPPIIERILPPEQIISILDNLRDGTGRSLDSKDAAAAHEFMLRSSSENHQNQFPQRRSPKPAPRSNRRPRTSNTSPTKRSHRDVIQDQRTTSPALTTRRTLGSIQSSMSEQSGLSLPPPPRMSKRPSGTSLAATLENAEEGNQPTSFSTPHTKNKKLSRSASEAAISTESSGSTPIQDLNSAFPSPIRRSRRQQSSNDKENDIGRKRSNSTLSCQSSEDLHCSSQEVLLESEDKEVESFSSRLLLSGESCDNWTTFGNHHKTLTASQTSNTFVNVESTNSHGDESFATVTASNSSSSTLEGSQEAVLFHVTGKKVISQL